MSSDPYHCHFCRTQEGWHSHSIPNLLNHYGKCHFKDVTIGCCATCKQTGKSHQFLFMHQLSVHTLDEHPELSHMSYDYLDTDMLVLRQVLGVLKYVTCDLKCEGEAPWYNYLIKVEKNRSSEDENH